MSESTYKTIDEYILMFPEEVQKLLQSMREVIMEVAPEAEQKISWQMATFTLHGNLVHFAAHKNHIGFYPGASGVEVFKKELSGYKTSKGAIQFPFNQPLPFNLIREIVQYRVLENKKAAEEKALKKAAKAKNTKA